MKLNEAEGKFFDNLTINLKKGSASKPRRYFLDPLYVGKQNVKYS